MEFVNGKDDIPYTIDNKTCLKWKNKKSSKKNKLSSPVTHQVTVSFINPSWQRYTTELRRWRHMPCQLRKLLEQAAARALRRREEQRPQTVAMHRGFFDESVQNTWISDGEVGIRLGHIMKIMIDIIYEFHIYIYIYVGEKMFQIIGISLLHMGVFVVILLWHVMDVRQQMPRI